MPSVDEGWPIEEEIGKLRTYYKDHKIPEAEDKTYIKYDYRVKVMSQHPPR
jgi:hypothetical protein